MPGLIELPRPFTFILGPQPDPNLPEGVKGPNRELRLPAGRHLVDDEILNHPFTRLARLQVNDRQVASAAPAAAMPLSASPAAPPTVPPHQLASAGTDTAAAPTFETGDDAADHGIRAETDADGEPLTTVTRRGGRAAA